MQTRRMTPPLAFLLATTGALALAGCPFQGGDFCTDHPEHCTSGAGGGTTTSDSGSTTTTAASMTTNSSTSSIATECDPKALAPGASIAPTCGLFVDAGKSGGDGSQGAPFGSLDEALTKNPNNLPIYACAGTTLLIDGITLSGTERLIGGVTCGDWKATAMKTGWTTPTNVIPLRLDKTSGVLVQGFAIEALGATGFDGATLQGASSIGVWADGATATFVDVDIVAGDGAPGGDGMDQGGQAPGMQDMAAAFNGVSGSDGVGSVCGDPSPAGPIFMTCPAGGQTFGGDGGAGGLAVGGPGSGGAPDPLLGEPNGSGGAGEPSAGAFDCAGNNGNGEFGHGGPAGGPGSGGTSMGMLTSTGYAGASGGTGGNGTIGQGAGGGGGRKGNNTNGCGVGVKGPTGGSGGAGGCGGLAGGGGGAGGASIALVSLSATLTLTNVHLSAGVGGAGGAGGDGQLGGIGGVGGIGGGVACQGGSGGKGGDGGSGGGGRGGPSIGLASVGVAAVIDDANITVSGSAAAGGPGGNGSVPGAMGASGETVTKASFGG